LRCPIIRLGLRDDDVTEEQIEQKLRELPEPSEVYAPALQGGNVHHDMVHRVALKVFGKKVTQYTTYTKTELYTTGNIEIFPSANEKNIKRHALECYQSQLAINGPHFLAVVGKSEWLIL
jgi:LmbE family N-acetylglucosaminyl deacetylase